MDRKAEEEEEEEEEQGELGAQKWRTRVGLQLGHKEHFHFPRLFKIKNYKKIGSAGPRSNNCKLRDVASFHRNLIDCIGQHSFCTTHIHTHIYTNRRIQLRRGNTIISSYSKIHKVLRKEGWKFFFNVFLYLGRFLLYFLHAAFIYNKFSDLGTNNYF